MATTTGIYVIENTESRKVYVGSSCDVRRRWSDHVRELRQGIHGNDYLQKACVLHGEPTFRFWVAETCPREALLEREQWWLDMFEPWDPERGYNIRENADGSYVPNVATLAKMSAAQRLRFCDPAQRDAISRANKGREQPFTAEHRSFLAAERRRAWLGRKHTPEARAKMSAAKKGKQPWLGKRHSDETKRKISEAKRGRIQSPEEREKRRQGMLRAWASGRRK